MRLDLHAIRLIVLSAALSLPSAGCAPSTGNAPSPPSPDGRAGLPADGVDLQATSQRDPTAWKEATARWAVEPVPVGSSFERAVERGTRTRTGAPGPENWTQEVDYRIEVELEPETATLRGSQTITYRNNSPDTLDRVFLHLYQNLFSEGQQRTRTVPVTGGITLDRVAIGNDEVQVAGNQPQQGSYLVDGTLMAVFLRQPLPPGGDVVLGFDWAFEVPPAGAPRHGHLDHGLFNVAQWYPQIAAYDDVTGWHLWPYLGNAEFYLEYGDFDVSLTVPDGWLVGASGTLQNPESVLSDSVRARLDRALQSEDVVRVVTEPDLDAGIVTLSGADGTLTWRFLAERVRDFAFATSNQYLWDATHAVGPDADADGEEEIIAVHSFYRPGIESWVESAEYIRHALAFHAERWHPYPWPQMTGAEGPVGGMEYPMLTFVGAFPTGRTVYEVLNHEIGHMWYPMMVGSNEASFPWMDEGLTTYIEGYATADYFDEPEVWHLDQDNYLAVAGLETETPIMRHGDLHGYTGTYTQAAYSKPATLLRALEAVIGRDAVWESLRTYARSWIYRHPQPHDFFNTVEEVSGRDLDWFWYPWWYETATLDQAIAEVRTVEDGGIDVVVRDLGEAPMPIDLAVTLSDGGTIRGSAPVDVWLSGAREHTVHIPIPEGVVVESVEIDPESDFPDVDRDNNVWGN